VTASDVRVHVSYLSVPRSECPKRPNDRDALHCLRYGDKFQTVSAFLADMVSAGGRDTLPVRVAAERFFLRAGVFTSRKRSDRFRVKNPTAPEGGSTMRADLAYS
jgi:hypothetical protein